LQKVIFKKTNMNKKLYRGNGYIGGVCEGLGEWSGIPSILWRVGFLSSIPATFWVYVILWIFLSKPVTSSVDLDYEWHNESN
tara:strand:- start:731 stop:976 length:246 start_codon:yes stop_codon:yes gene_type:complete